jgi:hypothetical protein
MAAKACRRNFGAQFAPMLESLETHFASIAESLTGEPLLKKPKRAKVKVVAELRQNKRHVTRKYG